MIRAVQQKHGVSWTLRGHEDDTKGDECLKATVDNMRTSCQAQTVSNLIPLKGGNLQKPTRAITTTDMKDWVNGYTLPYNILTFLETIR